MKKTERIGGGNMKESNLNHEFPVALYAYEDPREPGHIRYIGKTVNPLSRHAKHLSDRCGAETHCAAWFRQLQKEGVEPRQRFLGHVPGDEADEAERRVIKGYQTLGFNLLNQTSGGAGKPGFSPTLKTRQLLKAKRPLELRQRISRTLKGRPLKESHRYNVIVARRIGIMIQHTKKFYAHS